MLKYKRTLWIAFAVVFIVVLILIRIKPLPKQEAVVKEENGLSSYDDQILADVVNKDTDGDGVSDWEESLWGTDPKKQDTDSDGVKDDVEIAEAKEQKQTGTQTTEEPENLTETDKFSRELFSTIASLNQSGEMDQGTVDALSNSLSDEIQNSAPRKVFLISQIKITNDTTQAMQNYSTSIGGIFNRHTINVSIPDILSESLTSDGDINATALNKLDPVIKHIQGIINEMLAMNNVPSSISLLHLDTLNAFERLAENLTDIKKVDSDTLIAMSAISQYQDNDDALKVAIEKLISALNQS